MGASGRFWLGMMAYASIATVLVVEAEGVSGAAPSVEQLPVAATYQDHPAL